MDDHAHNVREIKVMVANDQAIAVLPCSTSSYPHSAGAARYSKDRAVASKQQQRFLGKEAVHAVETTNPPEAADPHVVALERWLERTYDHGERSLCAE